MHKVLFLVFFLAFSGSLLAQNASLAQHYYRNGEYEKAAAIYKEFLETTKGNSYYLDKYIDCLMAVDDFATAEKVIKKAIKKKKRESTSLLVTYGKIQERQGKLDEAKKIYLKAIEKLPAARHEVLKLTNSFIILSKYDLAIKAFDQGEKLLKDKQVFAMNLADLYRRKGDYPKMISSYLVSLNTNPGNLYSIKSNLNRYLPEKDYDELKEQLYDQLQDDAPIQIQELLAWVFVHERDFENAFRQEKAIDARQKGDGQRVFELARLAQGEKAYKAAIQGYDYIVDNKGLNSTFYFESKQRALECKTILLTEGYQYSTGEIDSLLQEYNSFLKDAGKNRYTAKIMIQMAEIEAFYNKNPSGAMQILNDVIILPGANRSVVAEAKLRLGDMYLIENEIWESTLLYSQVDKEFKEDELGQEARFRNALLSYYKGDFEWAQTQFGVLKNATSRPIANNAIDRSVFIMDNLGLDTTPEPLRLYSQAEFAVFQNNFPLAFAKLDSLLDIYPDHALDDDVLFLKGEIEYKQQHFEKAAAYYEQVYTKYPDDIRADNALDQVARMNDNIFNNKEKTMQLYEKIFLKYADSTFADTARKRFRELRGDQIN